MFKMVYAAGIEIVSGGGGDFRVRAWCVINTLSIKVFVRV
jgi:hypothetical protein